MGGFINMISGVERKRVSKINMGLIKKFTNKYTIIAIVVLVSLVAVGVGYRELFILDSKTTKIGFEDIGELATQTAYCTEVNVTDRSRNLYGVKIPFTQSKYIYSYDIIIKAGFNFEDIEWKENETSIEVKLPEAKVLSSEINMDTFKVYHEEESIFTQISMTETNEAMKGLTQKAEESAIENGLLKNARVNVESILTVFFGNVYDLNEYEIVFKDK